MCPPTGAPCVWGAVVRRGGGGGKGEGEGGGGRKQGRGRWRKGRGNGMHVEEEESGVYVKEGVCMTRERDEKVQWCMVER